jgi:CBS domain-containing protein
MTDSNLRLSSIKAALDDIGAAGDAARLQLHLLALRARERTGDLASGVELLERRLDRGIEQAVQAATSKTRQLSTAVQELLGQGQAAPADAAAVASVMTAHPRSCSADDTASQAAMIMWDADCGAVPVLDGDGRLIGVVSDRDLCIASYTKGLPLTAIRVADVMARHVHTCDPDDTLARAAALMADAQVRRLPVVDAERRLVGIVSLADIARAAPVLGQHEGAELVFALLRALSQRPRDSQEAQRPVAE